MLCCNTARARKAISFPSTRRVSVRDIAAVEHSGVYFYHKSISTPKGECLDTVLLCFLCALRTSPQHTACAAVTSEAQQLTRAAAWPGEHRVCVKLLLVL